jgi:hypothetical protein
LLALSALAAVVALPAVFAVLALLAVFAEGTWPSVLSLMSAPVRASSRTFWLLTAPFRIFGVVTAPFAMSFAFTAPALMSPESTVFLPGRAAAVPDNAASKAMKVTAIAARAGARTCAFVCDPQ